MKLQNFREKINLSFKYFETERRNASMVQMGLREGERPADRKRDSPCKLKTTWVKCDTFWKRLYQFGFPGGSGSKESACNAGDPGWILGLGRSSGGGNGNPLQYPCLENPMDRGAWWATVHGVPKESDMTERLTLLLSYQFSKHIMSCLENCPRETKSYSWVNLYSHHSLIRIQAQQEQHGVGFITFWGEEKKNSV